MLELVFFACRNWLALVIGAFIGGAFLGGVALLQDPVYRSEVVLSPVTSESDPGLSALGALSDVAGMAGITLGGNTQQRTEAIATLTSRKLAIQFIKDRNLMPVLFEDEWDATAGHWKSDEPDETPSISDATTFFLKDVLRVIEDNDTGLVSLTIDWRDPDVAADWANNYVGLANRTLRARAIAESKASTDYLNVELARVDAVQLKQSIYSLLEARLKEQVVANVREEFAFRVIDPAIPADLDDPYKPNVLLSLIAGILLGLLVGLIVARDLESRRIAAEALRG